MFVYARAVMLSLLVVSVAGATAMEEVNQWRSQNGLPVFKEDKNLTAFAQHKAEWRAARLAQNGHQGPTCPAGCREGCGEATSSWGWLTCCQEETGQFAGAGVAIGADGQRYMVLVVKGTHGTAPRGRQIGGRGARLRIIDTSKLTPDAPRVPRVAGQSSGGTRIVRKQVVPSQPQVKSMPTKRSGSRRR